MEGEAGAVIDAITDSYNEALAGLNLNSDAPTETDVVADSDSEVDGDSGADAEADAEGEVEAAVDAHVSALARADSDSDLNVDADVDLGTDAHVDLNSGVELDSELKAAGDTEVVAGMEVRHQMADGKPSEGIPVEVTSPNPAHKQVIVSNFVPRKPGEKPSESDHSLEKALEA